MMKTFRILGSIFLCLSLVLGLLCYIIPAEIQRAQNDMESGQGVITGFSPVNSYPTIQYQAANGQEYTIKGRYVTTSMDVGDSVTIYYDPLAPWDAHQGYTYPIIELALGIPAAVLFTLGSVFYAFGQRMRRRLRLLEDRGVWAKGVITAIKNSALTVNNRRAQHITAHIAAFENRDPFEVTCKFMLDMPDNLAIGSSVSVLFDPYNTDLATLIFKDGE